MAQEREISYLNREFSDFRDALINYTKNYFPETYSDFSDTSPGMLFMEQASYIGDILSFYTDTQLQETYLQYAKQPANLYSLAYMMGYRPKVSTPSEVTIQVTQNVGAVLVGGVYVPNYNDALVINEGSQLSSNDSSNTLFLIEDKIDFTFSSSYDETEVVVASLLGNNPSTFQLKKNVKAYSVEEKTTDFVFTDVEKFATVQIDEPNIVSVLSIEDSAANKWYEVPFLGQDTVFIPTINAGADADKVPQLIDLQKVQRRFVTRFTSKGVMQIQFGAGSNTTDPEPFIPNPTNVGAGIPGGISRLDYAYDPSNFLYSNTYGISPSNTTLTVTYLVGGGVESNVPSNTIVNSVNVVATSIDGLDTYLATLAFNNDKAAVGGKDGDSIDELRQNTLRAFNEQKRAVTKDDYAIRVLSLPPQYGSVAKVYTLQDQLTNTVPKSNLLIDFNPLSLSVYVLAYNQDKHFINTTPALKQNIETYLSEYRMVTDAVNIKDAFVVNIGVSYDIIMRPGYSARDVLLKCSNVLKDYFDNDKMTINSAINLSDIYSTLDRVNGVQTVADVQITNKVGGTYSDYSYDIKGATRGGYVYPSLDPSIFEVKFPNSDIVGRVTTLL